MCSLCVCVRAESFCGECVAIMGRAEIKVGGKGRMVDIVVNV